MLQKTVGIVLHTLKYNDSSNIVEIYTELCGRASFAVSTSRSKKTEVKPILFQPLSLIELEVEIRPTSHIHRIKEAKTFMPFVSIPYHPYKSAISLFLAEFLYHAIREETENRSLFAYLRHAIALFDEIKEKYANFHLVFLMHVSRFLGLHPNLDNYHKGDYFDMLNGVFTSEKTQLQASFLYPEEASHLPVLIRMNYQTMHLYKMSRTERMRCLTLMNTYYRIHLPGFPELKSLKVLQELFD
ncbi:DNA repair protein RecO [termite gut metagenome]|uniref:DNA repair protein RecO n=1 Tax=termite gut metagenome TaxID=433724 RepID=A0A5J4PXA9_9ZZZZ